MNNNVNWFELSAFIAYFVIVIGIGIFFFVRNKDKTEKDYFLGGRNMNGLVSALSAGASDMSAWVLMGLPGVIFLRGLSEIWISIGLILGTIGAWILVAPRLRRFAIAADDSITIPQLLSNRFKSSKKLLSITCAIIFVIGYCLYSASSIYACGRLFNLLVPAVEQHWAMIGATVIIVFYTLLGGFNAVCWTDFFQGLLMLAALMITPIVGLALYNAVGSVGEPIVTGPNYWNFLSSGKFDWASISTILTGLGWGLGYFGMPHILVRYMAIKSEKEMRKSQIIGSCWTFIILAMATFVALVAHYYLGDSLEEANRELVFVYMVRNIFKYGGLALIGGILISAIVAASMSTADSQLLASSSAFSSDIYKSVINRNATDKQMLFVGRLAVIIVSLIALGIALTVLFLKLTDIMGLVSAAWSVFGSAFGPVIILCLFWRRLNYEGATYGIAAGFISSILWMILFNMEYYGFKSVVAATGLYEIIPGFIIGLITAIVVSLCTKAPSKEVISLFDKVKAMKNEDKNIVKQSN